MEPEFNGAWWLRSAHLQTVWGRIARSRRMVRFEREVLVTPDDDDLVVDHLAGLNGAGSELVADAPPLHFILLHGLEGSSYSVYIQGLLARIAARGHAATAMNFRFCARDPRNLSEVIPNRRPRVYHSGESNDPRFLIATLRARHPDRTFVAAGVSLGGNALLKYLGESGEESGLAAAVALSVPFDLAIGSRQMNRGVGWFYGASFLPSLKRKALSIAARFPGAPVDVARVRSVRTMWQFDDDATAPLHGFRDAADYYERSSSLRFLDRIRTRTLCISAEDDPLVPSAMIGPARDAASDAVTIATTRAGGHAGFVGGVPWNCAYWAEDTTVSWLERQVSRTASNLL